MDDSFEYSWTEPEIRRAWWSYMGATALRPMLWFVLLVAALGVAGIGCLVSAVLTPPLPGCQVNTDAARSGAVVAVLIAAGIGLGSLEQSWRSWSAGMRSIGSLRLRLEEDGLHSQASDGGAVFVPWSALQILEDKPHYFVLKRGLLGSWILPGSLPESIKQTMRERTRKEPA